MADNIGWELYRTLLAVLQEGSLSGAARSLGITQPTAGRHIEALERALKVSLFTRSQTGLQPTDIALALRPHAETMQSTAASLERAARSDAAQVQGAVRVAASEVVGAEVLPPIIAALRERYPQLVVELVLSNRVEDLLKREADVAVRMVRPKQTQLVARRIGNIELGLHARRDYLAKHGTPRNAAALWQHAIIGYDRPSAFVRDASKAFPGYSRAGLSIRTDNDLAQLALIRAGAGIGVCQVALARRDKSLVRVLPKLVALRLDTWVTMHEDLRSSPRCRATFDALVEGLTGYVR
ncbi:LysR family transcriptional regulator [Paraburkholderia graminis]|uniref:DNA-binding transcriptional LysR family regulator n=2 Tax=Paraburkholderia graminis TaxID=60548 RepID=A0ABD5C852_9BURK|nr:LysR family transcriptional regulator [Paraburkholderia graminis]MDR6201443.1 DNA-binding transcriptional LysR family regulator [Paraburkholderia graminis]